MSHSLLELPTVATVVKKFLKKMSQNKNNSNGGKTSFQIRF